MSKPSAQCDELRSMAASVGLEVPQAATLMMEAADTIEGLESENAKLREENQSIGLASYELGRKSMAAECDKLRELLDYVTPIAWYAASECERDRMRELGVEVDG